VPTYAYACTACEHRFEIVQSFSDDSLTKCPECEGRLRKLFNAVGVVFKGSGFYTNDSRSDSRRGSGHGSHGSSGHGRDSTGSGSGSSSESDSSSSKSSSSSSTSDSSSSSSSSSSSDSAGTTKTARKASSRSEGSAA
jgi:putative FmdB family regulatory protein